MTEPVDIFKELGVFRDAMPSVSAIYLYEPRQCVCCGSFQQKLWIMGLHSGLCDVCFTAAHNVIPNACEESSHESGFLPAVEMTENEIASHGSQ